MLLQRIQLQHFRNYQELSLEFTASLNLFVGENAQGKSNLLEGIYLAALGRSYRTTNDQDLIQWGAPFARVRAEAEGEAAGCRIEILLPREGAKEIRVGGQPLRRHSDLLGTMNAVIFSPDDLQLVKGAPALRRRFLDIELAQVSPAYRHHFARYHRVLRQRNNLLKAVNIGSAGRDALVEWDEQLIADGSRIIAKRARAVRRLAGWSREMQRRISGGREELDLVYRPFFARPGEAPGSEWEDPEAVAQRFREALAAVRREEVVRATTLVGPQRDDIAFMVGEIDLRYFGSQGQQRTAVLATKLAELEFVREEAGEYPVLLLDDVMSELDDERKARFLETVTGRINTFITTTGLESFTREILEQAAVYRIRAGTVVPEKV
ncbi:MAG: DNA replication/repair protein RecF [Clostridia bacterium]